MLSQLCDDVNWIASQLYDYITDKPWHDVLILIAMYVLTAYVILATFSLSAVSNLSTLDYDPDYSFKTYQISPLDWNDRNIKSNGINVAHFKQQQEYNYLLLQVFKSNNNTLIYQEIERFAFPTKISESDSIFILKYQQSACDLYNDTNNKSNRCILNNPKFIESIGIQNSIYYTTIDSVNDIGINSKHLSKGLDKPRFFCLFLLLMALFIFYCHGTYHGNFNNGITGICLHHLYQITVSTYLLWNIVICTAPIIKIEGLIFTVGDYNIHWWLFGIIWTGFMGYFLLFIPVFVALLWYALPLCFIEERIAIKKYRLWISIVPSFIYLMLSPIFFVLILIAHLYLHRADTFIYDSNAKNAVFCVIYYWFFGHFWNCYKFWIVDEQSSSEDALSQIFETTLEVIDEYIEQKGCYISAFVCCTHFLLLYTLISMLVISNNHLSTLDYDDDYVIKSYHIDSAYWLKYNMKEEGITIAHFAQQAQYKYLIIQPYENVNDTQVFTQKSWTDLPSSASNIFILKYQQSKACTDNNSEPCIFDNLQFNYMFDFQSIYYTKIASITNININSELNSHSLDSLRPYFLFIMVMVIMTLFLYLNLNKTVYQTTELRISYFVLFSLSTYLLWNIVLTVIPVIKIDGLTFVVGHFNIHWWLFGVIYTGLLPYFTILVPALLCLSFFIVSLCTELNKYLVTILLIPPMLFNILIPLIFVIIFIGNVSMTSTSFQYSAISGNAVFCLLFAWLFVPLFMYFASNHRWYQMLSVIEKSLDDLCRRLKFEKYHDKDYQHLYNKVKQQFSEYSYNFTSQCCAVQDCYAEQNAKYPLTRDMWFCASHRQEIGERLSKLKQSVPKNNSLNKIIYQFKYGSDEPIELVLPDDWFELMYAKIEQLKLYFVYMMQTINDVDITCSDDIILESERRLIIEKLKQRYHLLSLYQYLLLNVKATMNPFAQSAAWFGLVGDMWDVIGKLSNCLDVVDDNLHTLNKTIDRIFDHKWIKLLKNKLGIDFESQIRQILRLDLLNCISSYDPLIRFATHVGGAVGTVVGGGTGVITFCGEFISRLVSFQWGETDADKQLREVNKKLVKHSRNIDRNINNLSNQLKQVLLDVNGLLDQLDNDEQSIMKALDNGDYISLLSIGKKYVKKANKIANGAIKVKNEINKLQTEMAEYGNNVKIKYEIATTKYEPDFHWSDVPLHFATFGIYTGIKYGCVIQ